MNGNQFVQSYGATFYTQQGLGSMSFTYSTIGQVAGLVGSATGLVLFDVVGRRPPMIVGSLLCAIFLYLAAGVGLHKPLSTPAENTMLASFMLLPAFTRISATNTAFLTGAEIGGVHMRKKTMVSRHSPCFFTLTMSVLTKMVPDRPLALLVMSSPLSS